MNKRTSKKIDNFIEEKILAALVFISQTTLTKNYIRTFERNSLRRAF